MHLLFHFTGVITGIVLVFLTTSIVLYFVFKKQERKENADKIDVNNEKPTEENTNSKIGFKRFFTKRNIIIASSVGAIVIACAAAIPLAIGAGTSEGGNNNEPPINEYICEHKCSICGGCMDLECDNENCATKCGDMYDFEDIFNLADIKVAISGATRDHGSLVISDFSLENKSSVSVKFDSSAQDNCSLQLEVQNIGESVNLSDSIDILLNGTKITSTATIPQNTSGYSYISLGCSNILEGSNSISLIAKNTTPFKLKSLKIIGSPLFELRQANAIAHECTSKCSTCGGCTNFSCLNDGCINKCICESKAKAHIFWVCDERCETNRDVNKELDGIGCTWGQTTSMIYKIDSDRDITVKFGAVVSRDTKGDNPFTTQFDVLVNGERIEGEGLMPQGESRDWNDYSMIVVGEMHLIKGTNIIDISQTPLKDKTNQAYNFQSFIIFSNEGTFTWANKIDDNGCKSKCELCQKCKDAECVVEGCAEKCDCKVTEFKAVDEKVIIGGVARKHPTEHVLGITNSSYNKEATAKFVIRANKKETVRLSLVVSSQTESFNLNSIYRITHNGKGLTTTTKTKIGTRYSDYSDLFYSIITLEEGENVFDISFTFTKSSQVFNLDKLCITKLNSSDLEVEFA